MKYPKRLIEVDLPIKRISAHSSREKSIRHGHISTLHTWWARRPLAACRAVLCATLWPDPLDELCPEEFRNVAQKNMLDWSIKTDAKLSSKESLTNFLKIRQNNELIKDNLILRKALLDFIADFANWDNSTVPEYLNICRKLTKISHESLGGITGSKPLVVDPFAGGGSIPLESLRVGCDTFASDLNPLPVLLNKVILEYIPKYSVNLLSKIKEYGEYIRNEAKQCLEEYYPKDLDGATPIGYLWARTIICEGPGCGITVPLLRSLWVAKKGKNSVAIEIITSQSEKKVSFKFNFSPKISEVKEGTLKRGSVTCPLCNYTTHVDKVRQQLKNRSGGTNDSLLYAKFVRKTDGNTEFRLPTDKDFEAMEKVRVLSQNFINDFPELMNSELPPDGALGIGITKYGMNKWKDIYNPRQLLMLITYSKIIKKFSTNDISSEQLEILRKFFALTFSKMAGFSSSLCIWRPYRSCVAQTFTRQALTIIWDYGEMNPFANSAGDFGEAIDYLYLFIKNITDSTDSQGISSKNSATNVPLPDNSVDILFTDPPYYDAVPYSHISEYFLIWLKLMNSIKEENTEILIRRKEECIVDTNLGKNKAGFEKIMTDSMEEGIRYVRDDGIAILVFAHKSTSGWESQLKSMINSGWVITGSWPIDTERPGRPRANNSAALASSIHLICRPRNKKINVGDWRDVLQELPKRIHEWMPRLAEEGVVGADAIFACLGPALEIFSQYSSVEKPNGDIVILGEYLEHVWAAVAKEGLNMIFSGADTSAFEPDARLTAMWLWTLGASDAGIESGNDEEIESEDEEDSKKPAVTGGFKLEYDAARKIAQGLGAHLEQLTSLIEVKGSEARLLPVAERTEYLLGLKGRESEVRQKKVVKKQLTMFEAMEEFENFEHEGVEVSGTFKKGKTVLDQVHQSMILFAAGKGDTMKRFLTDEGVGNDERFWKLAQSLSSLYPSGTDEKRWVDGVLARKKGLGF